VVPVAAHDPADGSVGVPAVPGRVDGFARELAEAVRPVAARLSAEMAHSARTAGLGAGLLAGAGLLTVAGIASGALAVLRAWQPGRAPRRGAAILTGGLLAAAGVLAVAGVRRLRPTARFSRDVRQAVAAIRAGVRDGSSPTR
jgi:hypothetical protein